MENRNLGRGQVSVPAVGLGTWRRLEAAAAAGRHRELISAAIAAGITLFDTSPMYGESERVHDPEVEEQRGRTVGAAVQPSERIGTPAADSRIHENGTQGLRRDLFRFGQNL